MSNGRLDTRALTPLVNFHPIDSHAGGLALPEVAHQWALMAAACLRATGHRLDASEGYRDIAGQQYWKTYWTRLGKPQNAAAVGGSNHGLGTCVDAGSGAGTNGTAVETWLEHNARSFGFVRDVGWELWHLHYIGSPTITTLPAALIVAAAPIQEDDMKARENLVMLETNASKLPGIRDTWLVNPDAFTYIHMSTANQIKVWKQLGVTDLTGGAQPSSVLNGFRCVDSTSGVR